MRRARDKLRGAWWFGTERLPRMVADSIRNGSATRGASGPTDLREAADTAYSAAWLGHAGVLLRQGQTTILVDPVLSERIGPRIGGRVIGPGRLGPAPVGVDRLPGVDLVLITHAHFDHLDRPTLERLARPGTVVVTSKRTRGLIPRGFGGVLELHWDGEVEVGGVRVSALRPEHWGGRTAIDLARGCNSYLVQSDDRRTLAPGDTAETGEFGGLGRVDLATFGIGAYSPSEHHHATPEQVWSMFRSLPGDRLLPVHHSTFEISGEHIDEPLSRLLAAASGEPDRVVRVDAGQLWTP